MDLGDAHERVFDVVQLQQCHALVVVLLVEQSGQGRVLDPLHGADFFEDPRDLFFGVDLARDVREVERFGGRVDGYLLVFEPVELGVGDQQLVLRLLSEDFIEGGLVAVGDLGEPPLLSGGSRRSGGC